MVTGSMQLFFALSILIIILIAGWVPFKKRMRQGAVIDFPLGESLATGVFLQQLLWQPLS